MIRGIGVDIEAVARFRESCKDPHFLRLIFTEDEMEYCQKKNDPAISFAGKFCAKEAVVKASAVPLKIKDIEIRNKPTGKISLFIHGKESPNTLCTISHTEEYALAFVIITD